MEIQFLKQLRRIYAFWNPSLEEFLNSLKAGEPLPLNLEQYIPLKDWEKDEENLETIWFFTIFLEDKCKDLHKRLSSLLSFFLLAESSLNDLMEAIIETEDLIEWIKQKVQARKIEFNKRIFYSQEDLKGIPEEIFSEILEKAFETLKAIKANLYTNLDSIDRVIKEKRIILDGVLKIFEEIESEYREIPRKAEIEINKKIQAQIFLTDQVLTKIDDFLEQIYQEQISLNELISFLQNELLPFIEKKIEPLKNLKTAIQTLEEKLEKIDDLINEIRGLNKKLRYNEQEAGNLVIDAESILEYPEGRETEEIIEILTKAKEVNQEISSNLDTLQKIISNLEGIKDQLEEEIPAVLED